MMKSRSELRSIRFGNFEADLHTGELRRNGTKLKFSGQPFQVLSILLEHPGDVVTREELQKRQWPDTFVDVDRNLNTAINKIREVLDDSAEFPLWAARVSKSQLQCHTAVHRPIAGRSRRSTHSRGPRSIWRRARRHRRQSLLRASPHRAPARCPSF